MSKKIFLFIFITIVYSFQAQVYEFNYLIQEKVVGNSGGENEWLNTYFYNSDTKNLISLKEDYNVSRAFLSTNDKSKMFTFKVRQVQDILRLDYLHTSIFEKNENPSDSRIEIKKLDDLKYELKIFNNKEKRPTVTVHAEFEESDFEFIDIRLDHKDGDLLLEKLKEKLDSNKKYLLRKYRINYKTGARYVNKITNIQKCDLKVEVPTDQKLKKYDYYSEFEK